MRRKFRRKETAASRFETLIRIGALSLFVFVLTPALFLTSSLAQKHRSARPDPSLGRRIYREGVLPSGKPVRAVVQEDIALEGEQASCASCHRRSGFGESEGAVYVPPVAGSMLYGEKETRRTDLFRKLFQEAQPNQYRARVRDPRSRPAYTDATLARALREGVDPSGRTLDAPMPLYDLSDEDAAHLIAYLKTLSYAHAPGVARDAVHFATVFAGDVSSERRRATLEVFNAYFNLKNKETRGLLERPGHAAFYDEESYAPLREWRLHVWELKGDERSWPAQLEAHYERRPVFALLGGAGEGDWRAVHDFCERAETPCIFPNTAQPYVADEGAYAVYLSKGLTAEAEALALHLRETSAEEKGKIVQVFRDEAEGRTLARAFREGLSDEDRARLRDLALTATEKHMGEFWRKTFEEERPSTLVLWLEDEDLSTLARASLRYSEAVRASEVGRVFLSYGLLEASAPNARAGLAAPRALRESLSAEIFLTYPYALPQAAKPHAFRARAWMRSRKIERTHEREQLNLYFALNLTDHALANLAGNFNRDFFIESVERETELVQNPGVFPRLSLGPGQRFASRGCYIVKLSESGAKDETRLEAASVWLVP